MAHYSMQTTVKGTYDEVKEKVTGALKEQGFGILTEIDAQKTLKEKLGADMERYEILGACNPQLAHQALDADRSIGLLLPCNVVLRETAEGTEVSILDPEVMFEVADAKTKAKLADLPRLAKERLQAALEHL
jgi:uncharacterized protein (DUF302 family)